MKRIKPLDRVEYLLQLLNEIPHICRTPSTQLLIETLSERKIQTFTEKSNLGEPRDIISVDDALSRLKAIARQVPSINVEFIWKYLTVELTHINTDSLKKLIEVYFMDANKLKQTPAKHAFEIKLDQFIVSTSHSNTRNFIFRSLGPTQQFWDTASPHLMTWMVLQLSRSVEEQRRISHNQERPFYLTSEFCWILFRSVHNGGFKNQLKSIIGNIFNDADRESSKNIKPLNLSMKPFKLQTQISSVQHQRKQEKLFPSRNEETKRNHSPDPPSSLIDCALLLWTGLAVDVKSHLFYSWISESLTVYNSDNQLINSIREIDKVNLVLILYEGIKYGSLLKKFDEDRFKPILIQFDQYWNQYQAEQVDKQFKQLDQIGIPQLLKFSRISFSLSRTIGFYRFPFVVEYQGCRIAIQVLDSIKNSVSVHASCFLHAHVP